MWWTLLLASALLAAPPQGRTEAAPPPVGTWHAMLVPVPGVEVRFGLRIESREGTLGATLVNGQIESRFSSAEWADGILTATMAHLDGRLLLRLRGDRLEGAYVRATGAGRIEIPCVATKLAPGVPVPAQGAAGVDGTWGIELVRGEGKDRLLGTFRQQGGVVSAGVSSPSGDYGPLNGTWDGRKLVLSVFDGVFVYRFEGTLLDDGTLAGEFRSRASAPLVWSAKRLSPGQSEAFLPDGNSALRAKDAELPISFSFPDLTGETVSSTGERLSGRPLIVSFSGTWCPNCNDEAPVLQQVYAKFRSRGLEVVALFFEASEDSDRNRRLVDNFGKRHGVQYSLLLAGTTANAKTSPVHLQLEGPKPYPTTLFLDRQHRLVRAHTGFDGPATGERFERLKREFEAIAEELVKETSPTPRSAPKAP